MDERAVVRVEGDAHVVPGLLCARGMKHFGIAVVIAASLLGNVGCVEEETLGSNAEELTRKEIYKLGGTCSLVDGGTVCRLCRPRSDDPGVMVCTDYDCPRIDDISWQPECTVRPGNVASGVESLSIWIEAESGLLTAPLQATALGGASSGVGVLVPASSSTPGGSVRFNFEAPTGGATFYAWARTSAASSAANAFEFRVDSGGYKLLELPVTGTTWAWSRVADANNEPGAFTGFFVPAGGHSLRFYRREPGAKLDRILLTTNPDFVPDTQVFEAEALQLVPPMQIGATGSSPLATRYLWVPPGTGTGGLFDLQVTVPSDSFYSLWARTNAPSVGQDSFYMSSNFGEQALWGLPATTATGWKWGQVTDYYDASQVVNVYFSTDTFINFFRFFQREAGAKIDRIIVTNDPGFVPVDNGAPNNGF